MAKLEPPRMWWSSSWSRSRSRRQAVLFITPPRSAAVESCAPRRRTKLASSKQSCAVKLGSWKLSSKLLSWKVLGWSCASSIVKALRSSAESSVCKPGRSSCESSVVEVRLWKLGCSKLSCQTALCEAAKAKCLCQAVLCKVAKAKCKFRQTFRHQGLVLTEGDTPTN